MFASETLGMNSFGSRLRILGPAVLATAALLAGCGSSGGSHPAATLRTTTTQPSRSSIAPPSTRAGASTPTTVAASDLAALKQQLDAAGSSLGGADAALAQSDPNQTKNSEGTTP